MENSCSICDNWTYKDMKVVFLENQFLRIGILVDRGSDIFEFRYKPQNIDPLLRLPKGIRNPMKEHTHIPNMKGKFEEYYYGGWQEIVPNSTSFNYKGAFLGQHGEVSLVPWKYSIIKDSAEEVQLKVWIKLLKLPLLLEKTFTLKIGEARLFINERLTNEGGSDLDIMWGHHIAFGLPFLEEGAKIETNAVTFRADPTMPEPRRFGAQKEYTWPDGEDFQGAPDNASLIPDTQAEPYSDLCYLEGYGKDAYYTIRNSKRKLAFDLRWNGELFKCLWLWQERYATQGFPWWGKCYTVALEPWSSAGSADPNDAIAKGEWLKIKRGEVISTNLSAGFIEG